MKKRVVISEEQYKRVFLSEQPVTWQVPDGNSLLNWKSTSNIEDLTRNGVVTTEQKTIAKLYRLWANSTDELSKKYGKKSIYDLDEKSNNPYGGTFLKSYKVGKSKFDTTWLASSDGSDFINLSKGGKHQYSYDYKRKSSHDLTGYHKGKLSIFYRLDPLLIYLINYYLISKTLSILAALISSKST